MQIRDLQGRILRYAFFFTSDDANSCSLVKSKTVTILGVSNNGKRFVCVNEKEGKQHLNNHDLFSDKTIPKTIQDLVILEPMKCIALIGEDGTNTFEFYDEDIKKNLLDRYFRSKRVCKSLESSRVQED